MKIIVHLIVFVFLINMVCIGQTPYYYTITDANELPSNEVYDLYQDKPGYIWIACEAGLVRYDGNSFKTYITPTNCGRAVSKITPDSRGRIYVRDFLGNLVYLDKNSETLKDFLPFREIKKNYYSDFIVDRSDDVWISTHKLGLYHYNPYTQDQAGNTVGKETGLFSKTFQHNFSFIDETLFCHKH